MRDRVVGEHRHGAGDFGCQRLDCSSELKICRTQRLPLDAVGVIGLLRKGTPPKRCLLEHVSHQTSPQLPDPEQAGTILGAALTIRSRGARTAGRT